MDLLCWERADCREASAQVFAPLWEEKFSSDAVLRTGRIVRMNAAGL